MLLKPATPLTVLLLAAFVLLLLSTLSTPVIKGIPLATFQNVDLGVFGFCKGSQCSKVRVGYSTDHLFETEVANADFNLPSSARNSLSSILIVHPVAAFLTLVCLIMAAASHFRSPSHSPRYLLALLILLLPTVLVSLLAFLVDILLFVPHLSWGGWIVLAATIIIVACGVVTCAMRRTLVSRKARKRRIAENAEMNGQNFYGRHNADTAAMLGKSPFAPSAEAKTPFSYQTESAPTFARFEVTSQRNDNELRRLDSTTSSSNATRMADEGRYNSPSGRPGNPPGNVPRDAYGNQMTAPGPYETDPRMVRSHSDPRLQNQYSDRLQNQYSDGNLASRRGGYGSRGHGPPPRGPPGPPMRGGYPPPRGAPRGRARGRGAPPRGAPPMRGRTPPPGYPRPGGGYPGGYDQYGAMPVGVPHGTPSGQPYGSDRDGPGFEAPEPQYRDEYGPYQDQGPRPPQGQVEPQPPPLQSAGNVHDGNEPYVPPRAEWGNLNVNGNHGGPRSAASTDYYEDVDPRFAEPNNITTPSHERLPSALVPGAGGAASGARTREQQPPAASGENPEVPAVPPPDEDNNMGNDSDYNRLSNVSDTSHFTSISERPINPRWQESLNHDLPPVPPPPPPVPRSQDVILSSNPDFELPMPRPGRGRGRGRGGRGGRGGGRMTPVNEFDYLGPGTGGGRYPGI